MTFVIISNNRLESHELHIYVSRAIGIFIIRICGKAQQIIRGVNMCNPSPMPNGDGISSIKSINWNWIKTSNNSISATATPSDLTTLISAAVFKALTQEQTSISLHTCSFLLNESDCVFCVWLQWNWSDHKPASPCPLDTHPCDCLHGSHSYSGLDCEGSSLSSQAPWTWSQTGCWGGRLSVHRLLNQHLSAFYLKVIFKGALFHQHCRCSIKRIDAWLKLKKGSL